MGGDIAEASVKVIVVTVPSVPVGEMLARALVQGRKAACANLSGPIRSFYHWEGSYEESNEHWLVLKTQAGRVDELLEELTRLHPYECPAIEVVPVEKTPPQCLAWILSETA